MTRAWPVAIVGGGPVGLTLALCLARQGVSSVILERNDGATGEGSRAICQQRDVLDTWDAVGASAIWREGLTWSRGRTYVRDREVRTVELADVGRSELPAFVNISQLRVESILRALVAERPMITLRTGFCATSIVDDDAGVRVVGSRGEVVEAAWVAVCAGAHADGLRRALGVELAGETHPDRFLICDVKVDLDTESPERRFWFDPEWNPGRQVLLHAQPDGLVRIDWQVPEAFDLEAEAHTGRLDERIRAVVGERPYDLVWASVYRFHSRLATGFVVGRSALVGDAAHLMAPFGARGLNSGVHDAENLAWKLAAVLRSTAPASLVRTYDEERRQAARRNLEVTAATMRFLAPRDPHDRQRREAILAGAFAGDAEAMAAVDSGRLYEPACYDGSSLTTDDPRRAWLGYDDAGRPIGPAAGMLLPDVPTADGTRVRAQLRFTGGIIGPGWVREATERVHADLGLAMVGLERAHADPDGVLADALGLDPDEGVVVRPDCHVAGFATSPSSAVAVAARAWGWGGGVGGS
ncbi:monooxygenase FAD-binding [Acidimicrobium ferrooxidans DSM 10331]|uniref:Monooxygenase FAD-binding n=1 Tax=Acidimicrobium ferrooxidans (strain DSM 10331 / JCM 15462 / NBRC 103882 / ICP) TaxID=525909 RepID=C7LYF2_ACIFD|nr:FAD-dependent oxidoreductase [Acidimicrobium ferrooxidans]ACU53760.1 monooxygenase FAD-binding [Acidimicrobium ferrooxidans DSM 10331]